MFFGIDTTKKYIENLNFFEIRELTKPTTTNFLLTGTLEKGTLIKKVFNSFRNVVVFTTFIEQIQIWYVSDDVVITEYLTVFLTSF